MLRFFAAVIGGIGCAVTKCQELSLTSDFTPPNDACATYRALFDALSALERDMHQHIHKENNILFPRAERLESSFSVTEA